VEVHPSSAVHDCLFIILAVMLHIRGLLSAKPKDAPFCTFCSVSGENGIYNCVDLKRGEVSRRLLGAVEKLRKPIISGAICPSVCPPLCVEKLSFCWTDCCEVFHLGTWICRESPSLVKIRQQNQALYMKT
jgi:hypothetical protein